MFSESKIYRLLFFVVSFYWLLTCIVWRRFLFFVFVYVTTSRIHFIRNLKYTLCVIKWEIAAKHIVWHRGKYFFFFKSGYELKCLGLSMDPRNKWRNQWQQTNTCRIMTIKIPSPTRLVEQRIIIYINV